MEQKSFVQCVLQLHTPIMGFRWGLHYNAQGVLFTQYQQSIYFISLSSRNSSTLSVFHFSILKTSFTSLFSSWSFRMGSAPRTKFILRFGNFAGLSLRTKACIWGNLPNFQLHTSRVPKAYLLVASSWPSAWQHFRQLCSREDSVRLKGFNSSHELQSKFTENPMSLHCSGVNSDTVNWISAKKIERKGDM